MKPPLYFAVAVVFCARSASCQETKCLEPTSLQVHNRVQGAGDFETEFPVGYTLRYRCGPGYIKDGRDTWNATCIQKEDGSVDWDIDQYDCSPVSCGHPGDVHNGRLLNFDFHFPKNVRYDCNEGYELEGQPILYCQSDAKWNAPTPTCRIVECSRLERIANGTVRSVGTVFGSKAEFSCYQGFKLVGISTRTCGADGRWTGQYPYCEVVECGHMEGIANGILVISGTVFGSKANFSCRRGFELVGDNTRTCNAEGRWTGESPHCEVVECGVLEDIANGTVRLSGSVYGSKADFSCNRGFKLVGENTHTCDADGRWTGESPRCEEIWCSGQMIQEFVQRNGNGSVLVGNEPISGRQRSNTRVRYICPPNTDLDGSEINICQENGGWLFDTPACRQKCVVPGASEAFVQHSNSWRKRTVMKPHEEVRDGERNLFVSCKQGYHLLATSEQLICRNGAWEPPLPWCAEDGCRFEDLPRVENGRPSSGQSLAPRSLATYDCDSQFEIQRAGRLRCIQRQWLGEPPSCVHKKCVVPDASRAFVRQIDSSRRRTIMEPHAEVRDGDQNLFVSCKQGYHLLAASARLICRNGAWEPPQPWCAEDGCRFEDLPQVENGRPSSGQSLAPRSLAAYDCDSQFEIQRAGRLRCIQGQWLGEPPSCVHTFPTTWSGRKVLRMKFQLNLNTSARIICRHERASKTREITVRGQPRYWCPLPPNNSEGPQPIRRNALTYHFKCKEGYEIEGKRHLHCLEHGEWDAPIPKCKPKFGVSSNHTASPQAEQTVAQPLNSAGPLVAAISAPASRESHYSNCTVPAHGYFWTTVGDARAPGTRTWIKVNQGENFVSGDVIYLQCAQQNIPLPVRCADGRWNPEPTCEKRNNCSVEDFFRNAPHGLVIPAAETYVRQNSTFRVSCDDGFSLVGKGSTATCLQDGSWHVPSHVTCIEGCGDFDTGPGGPTVEGRKAVYALGDSITLSCEDGTELQPRTERISCLGDRWSANEVPICVPAKKYETNGVINKGGKSA